MIGIKLLLAVVMSSLSAAGRTEAHSWCVLGACSVEQPVGLVGDGSTRRVIYVPGAERSVGGVRVMRHILCAECKGEVGKIFCTGGCAPRPRGGALWRLATPAQAAGKALGPGIRPGITSPAGAGWLYVLI